jgi:hypothetical protein
VRKQFVHDEVAQLAYEQKRNEDLKDELIRLWVLAHKLYVAAVGCSPNVAQGLADEWPEIKGEVPDWVETKYGSRR